MNQLGRDLLIAAALNGTPQIIGKYVNDAGGMCALGVLGFRLGEEDLGRASEESRRLEIKFDLRAGDAECVVCQADLGDETALILHYNDLHKLDFLAIANKL